MLDSGILSGVILALMTLMAFLSFSVWRKVNALTQSDAEQIKRVIMNDNKKSQTIIIIVL